MSVSTPTGITRTASRRTPNSDDDVVRGGLGDRDEVRDPAHHPGLHAGEAVPTAQRHPAAPRCRGGQLVPAVDRDRMVHGGDQRQAGVAQAQQPVAERLVVVHHVELAPSPAQLADRPQRERQRLGEAAGPHRRHLEGVDGVPELPQARRPERILVAVEVQARQRPQRGAVPAGHLVELRVGLAAEHLDRVTERDELAGEVPDVDALPAAVGLAAVGQQRDAQRPHRAPITFDRRFALSSRAPIRSALGPVDANDGKHPAEQPGTAARRGRRWWWRSRRRSSSASRRTCPT